MIWDNHSKAEQGAEELQWGLGFRVQGLGFRVQCLGFRVRVQGLGFRGSGNSDKLTGGLVGNKGM